MLIRRLPGYAVQLGTEILQEILYMYGTLRVFVGLYVSTKVAIGTNTC